MGYRLEISEVRSVACGGKLYGYVDDVTKLSSWKWLVEKGYLDGTKDGNSTWDYDNNHPITMFKDDFKKFIELYIKDYNDLYGENTLEIGYFQGALDSSSDYLLLEWY